MTFIDIEKCKEVLSEEYEGYEMCSVCSREFKYNIIPIKGVKAKCTWCGNDNVICSLCDGEQCGGIVNCEKQIRKSLIKFNLGIDI